MTPRSPSNRRTVGIKVFYHNPKRLGLLDFCGYLPDAGVPRRQLYVWVLGECGRREDHFGVRHPFALCRRVQPLNFPRTPFFRASAVCSVQLLSAGRRLRCILHQAEFAAQPGAGRKTRVSTIGQTPGFADTRMRLAGRQKAATEESADRR